MKIETELKYIRSSWKFVLIVTGVFIFSLIAGSLVSLKNLGLPENYLEILKNSFGWIKSFSPIEIMLIIFLNNAVKSLLSMVLGTGLGIIPIIFIGGNGIIVGLIVNEVLKEEGIVYVLAALLPHGIIEVPMVLISAGLGLRLGYSMYISMRGEKKDMRYELTESLHVFMKIIMPLLFVAAMIETFVTPLVVLMVLP
ncbi:MAG: stage II sporulation protein M [Candidatus Methanoperedens sp.]|nr:stage II sporulation protein M [Candidatus Methanoperedens sp.]